MINVTKTYLPDKEKYKRYVDEIYTNGWITNNGPLVKQLEKRLGEYLGVKNLILVSNGTAALEIAYRTLGLEGFAITTPFSFVATTSSLVTNGVLPIFADIDPKTFNIDPKNIEKLITPSTSAIVPVHIFGNACDVEAIDSIAKKHKLKVVYDAAHAFDVRYKEQSILNYGDISTLSFHATKLFHTIEGGALIVNDDDLVEKARYLINFGIKNAQEIPELGINAKMNEFEAAMGLCVLDDIEMIKNKCQTVQEKYEKELQGLVQFQHKNENSSQNYSYFPVVFESEDQLLKVLKALNEQDIFPRRYFYPSLDTLSYIEPKQCMSVSRDISTRILCLPIYAGLNEDEQAKIIKLIQINLKNTQLIILDKNASKLIENFVNEVDSDFSPKISSKVDIYIWSHKITENAINIAKINSDGEIDALLSFYANKEDESYISFLAVHPRVRGQKIAYTLLQKCIDYCTEIQFSCIKLQTSLSNQKMQTIYFTFGFIPQKILHDRGEDSSLFLIKKLGKETL